MALTYGSRFYYQKNNILHVIHCFYWLIFKLWPKYLVLKIIFKVNICKNPVVLSLYFLKTNLYVKFIQKSFFFLICHQSHHNVISKINSKYPQSNPKAMKWDVKFRLWFFRIRNTWKFVIYIYNGLLFSCLKGGNLIICDNMDGSWRHYAKWNKSDR